MRGVIEIIIPSNAAYLSNGRHRRAMHGSRIFPGPLCFHFAVADIAIKYRTGDVQSSQEYCIWFFVGKKCLERDATYQNEIRWGRDELEIKWTFRKERDSVLMQALSGM